MVDKKFLDADGVEYLYKKLSQEDYPNNKTLDAVLDALKTTLSGKADSDSPAFTGNVTAPTPEDGTSDDTVATTAFVMRIATNQDATATADDIVKGKTAYVGGTKVTGLLNVFTAYIASDTPDDSVGEDGDVCIIL